MKLIAFWSQQCATWAVREEGHEEHDLCPDSLTRNASDKQVLALVKETFEIDAQDTICIER